MARTLRHVTESDIAGIDNALLALRTARRQLLSAGARSAARYVARAIKSVEGAQRHAARCDFHAYFEDRKAQEDTDRDRLFDVAKGRVIDDGERAASEECNQSYNIHDGGTESHCCRCAPDEQD